MTEHGCITMARRVTRERDATRLNPTAAALFPLPQRAHEAHRFSTTRAVAGDGTVQPHIDIV